MKTQNPTLDTRVLFTTLVEGKNNQQILEAIKSASVTLSGIPTITVEGKPFIFNDNVIKSLLLYGLKQKLTDSAASPKGTLTDAQKEQLKVDQFELFCEGYFSLAEKKRVLAPTTTKSGTKAAAFGRLEIMAMLRDLGLSSEHEAIIAEYDDLAWSSFLEKNSVKEGSKVKQAIEELAQAAKAKAEAARNSALAAVLDL